MKTYPLLILSFLLFACNHDHKHGHGEEHKHSHEHKHGGANEHMHKNDFEDLVDRFESPERDEYQKPTEVLKELGDITGQKIMEIGSGTGYFSFKLVDAGAHVIAADVDERFQEFIKNKKDSLGTGEALELRKVPYDSPDLDSAEVDKVLIVNTYHHIEDRSEYFAKVLSGLKSGGELCVIDFYKKELPIGPPVEMKLSETEVVDELKAAGFSTFRINDTLLPYQYIIHAQ